MAKILHTSRYTGTPWDILKEPISKDSLLLNLHNVILTPHIGGLSYETFRAMMAGAIDNIISFEKDDFEQINNKKLL